MSANTSKATGLDTPNAEQEENLRIWRAVALQKMPYFSRLLFSLRVLNAPGLGTYGVDNHYRLYIDFDAVTEKGTEWNVDSLLHECSHLFAAHADLAKDIALLAHDRMTWNYATDASINDDLVASGCYSFLEEDPLPERFGQPNWKTAPFYFHKLKELKDKQDKNKPKPQQGQGQKDQNGQPSQGQGQQPGQSGSQGDNNGNSQSQGQGEGSDGQGQTSAGNTQGQGSGQANGQGQPFRGCGSGSGGPAAPWELDADDDLGGKAPAATSGEKERIRIQTATAVKEHSKSRGTVAAGFSEIADDILAPSKTPWQKVLSSHIRRAVASKLGNYDTDHSKRSRRRHRAPIKDGNGVVLGNVCHPGHYEPTPSIEVIRDTSGSMSTYDLGLATREIEMIAKRVGIRGKDLMVTDVDAAVHSTRAFNRKSDVAEAHGRGGTSMIPGIEAAMERKRKPTAIVVITDGYTPWPKERGRIPVVAAIVCPEENFQFFQTGGAEGVPDFIKTVCIPTNIEQVAESV